MDGKRAVARRAAELVLAEGPEVLGVGSGTTVRLFVEELARLGYEGLTVSTSFDTNIVLKKHKFKVLDIQTVEQVDLSVDGADEVFSLKDGIYAIKGGGAAMLREKVLAAISRKRVYIVDESKVSDEPCARGTPIPLEVVPSALPAVEKGLNALGVRWKLREARGKLGPVVTDNGNLVVDLDCRSAVEKVEEVERLPGVAVSGLFGPGLIDVVLIGERGKLP
ncbi:MAG: ribose 5-phosphate isomerase A [Crenarchaeota archaeon]|nr:ribose 5-phosphate isomerase A [Thermoproteota archaeon]